MDPMTLGDAPTDLGSASVDDAGVRLLLCSGGRVDLSQPMFDIVLAMVDALAIPVYVRNVASGVLLAPDLAGTRVALDASGTEPQPLVGLLAGMLERANCEVSVGLPKVGDDLAISLHMEQSSETRLTIRYGPAPWGWIGSAARAVASALQQATGVPVRIVWHALPLQSGLHLEGTVAALDQRRLALAIIEGLQAAYLRRPVTWSELETAIVRIARLANMPSDRGTTEAPLSAAPLSAAGLGQVRDERRAETVGPQALPAGGASAAASSVGAAGSASHAETKGNVAEPGKSRVRVTAPPNAYNQLSPRRTPPDYWERSGVSRVTRYRRPGGG